MFLAACCFVPHVFAAIGHFAFGIRYLLYSIMNKLSDSNFTLGLVTGLGVGVCLGLFMRRRLTRSAARRSFDASAKAGTEEASFDEFASGECKLVLVVRNDLKMGKGKAAAQCSHASVMAYNQLNRKDPDLLKRWAQSGQRKVVLKIDDEQSLLQLRKDAAKLGILTSLVRDAGHTQVAAGSLTVMGVGPAPEGLVDKATGHLKLY